LLLLFACHFEGLFFAIDMFPFSAHVYKNKRNLQLADSHSGFCAAHTNKKEHKAPNFTKKR